MPFKTETLLIADQKLRNHICPSCLHANAISPCKKGFDMGLVMSTTVSEESTPTDICSSYREDLPEVS